MCLVHHGGAGTLQRALAAGIPSVVTPIFADQFDNANAVTRLGAGVGFTKPLQQVTADSLARAIAAAETYRGNCANLAAELSQDGATQAAGVLDTFLREVLSGFAEVSERDRGDQIRGLPAGWVPCRTEEGEVYYHQRPGSRLGASRIQVLFLGSCLQSCHFDPVPAVAEHDNTGVGWDRSFKQRAGWDLLGAGKRPGFGLERRSWFQKEVDFEVLPEIFACAFRKLPWLASEQHLVVPMVPGVTSVAYDRLAKILHRRFQVPRLSLASAPLCALAAHELRSGAVVFGSDLGTSAIFCYQERVVVAELGPFDFFKATTHQIADLLAQAKTQLQGFPDVLQHVVLSSQPFLQVAERSRLIVRKNFQGWAKPEELQRALKVAGLGATVHGPELRDVVRGAEVLAPELPEHVVPSLPQSWEWRVFAQGQWQPLPSYVAAVFEGAWRNRQTLATVQVMANSHAYLLADLEEWTVQCCKCCKPMRLRGMAGKTSKEDFKPQGSVSRLTRFLRGRPSADPDLRRPEDFDVTTSEVQQVSGGGALHVRSLSGKLVFSQRRPLELSAVLSRCAQQLKVDVERLRLLDGAEEVDEKRFRSLEEQEEQAIDLQLVVGPALPKKDKFQEQIPEELPGEKLGNSHPLLKAVRTALQLRGLA
ncbi:unnamed protein product [Effrenium voratum]|nr:unnamed protein product [Effrenium voratum]